jgi:DNA mismatch repair protein MutS
LPKSAVERAKAVLQRLETTGGATRMEIAEELPLFAQVMEERAPSALEAALNDINPDHLSPKEALELLYKLKAAAQQDL